MFILCHAAKNEPRKRAKAFPLGSPRHCRATWRVWEKNMKDFYSSPAILPPRAAGGESKNSCCLGRGGACSSRFFAAGRSHCFARSLCGLLCYFFVIQQRSNQESEPRRSLLELPFRAALQNAPRNRHIHLLCGLSRQIPRAAVKGSKSFCFPACLKFFSATRDVKRRCGKKFSHFRTHRKKFGFREKIRTFSNKQARK